MLDKQFTNNLNIYLSYGSFYVKMEGITSLKERGSIYARIKGYKELDCWHTVVLFYFCQHRDHSHYSGGSIWDDASRNRSIVTVFIHYYWARMFRASFFRSWTSDFRWTIWFMVGNLFNACCNRLCPRNAITCFRWESCNWSDHFRGHYDFNRFTRHRPLHSKTI